MSSYSSTNWQSAHIYGLLSFSIFLSLLSIHPSHPQPPPTLRLLPPSCDNNCVPAVPRETNERIFEITHCFSRLPEWFGFIVAEITIIYILAGLRHSFSAWGELVMASYYIVSWYRTVALMTITLLKDANLATNASNLFVSIFTVSSGFFKRREDSSPLWVMFLDCNPMRCVRVCVRVCTGVCV